jgi:hypothetical protein
MSAGIERRSILMSVQAPSTLGELIERRESFENSRQKLYRFSETDFGPDGIPLLVPDLHSSATPPNNWSASFRTGFLNAVRKLTGR